MVMTSAEVINHQLQLMALSCILSHPNSSQLAINSHETPYALIAIASDFLYLLNGLIWIKVFQSHSNL